MKKYLIISFLSISIIVKGQHYSVDTIPYNPDTYSGTNVPLGGNSFSQMTQIGFPFCFYSAIYDSLKIGANGIVSFKPYNPYDNFCNNQIYNAPLPNPFSATSPKNCIMCPWQDLDPSLGGNIAFKSSGAAPNRIFIVSFDSIPMDSCSKIFKGQVKLFETTNIIEIHIAIKDTCANWNNGYAVLGLHGPSFLFPPYCYGTFVPGRSYPDLIWTATNVGYRFTPLVDVCSDISVYENGSGQNNFKLYPNPTTQFSTLEFDNFNKENCTLTLYNIFGQIVRIISDITVDKVIIEKQSLTSGLYFFRLVSGKQTIANGKLIFE